MDEQLVGVRSPRMRTCLRPTASVTLSFLVFLDLVSETPSRGLGNLMRTRELSSGTLPRVCQNDRHLRQYLSGLPGRGLNASTSLLLVSLDGATSQRDYSAEVALKGVAQAIKSSLRLGDLLFRLQHDEILCVLHGADAMTAHLVLLRVTEALSLGLRDQSEGVALSTGVATPPIDGRNLDELVRSARSRLVPVSSGLITYQRPS